MLINDNKVPRDWIFTAVYVEKTSLKAPLLKLEIHDATGTVIDDWKAKYGASLVAEMGDPNGNAGTFKTDFFVTSAMLAGDVLPGTYRSCRLRGRCLSDVSLCNWPHPDRDSPSPHTGPD